MPNPSIVVPGSTEVRIPVGGETIGADLNVPDASQGMVLFAHGSGSSRFSRRNRAVAEYLSRAGIGTLLLDLLTESEDRVDTATAQYRFDIPLLASRLITASDWISAQAPLAHLPIAYFGASTGAAAALVAAAERQGRVVAVVSRGGRPDLAGPALPRVRASSLLIVGGAHPVVLELNEQALARMTCPRKLEIVPGATHLFEEPGALERVAELVRDWFLARFSPAPAS